MTSALIPALAVKGSVSGTPPTPVTDGEHDGLLCTQTSHAREIAKRGAHLLVQVKGDHSTLHAQLKALPWPQAGTAYVSCNSSH